MSIDLAVTVLTCLVGVGVSILLASVPWAYSVHGRLTKIETTLIDQVGDLRRLGDLEIRLLRLEMQTPAGKNSELAREEVR